MRTFQPFGFALFGVLFLSCGGPMGTGPPEEGALRTGEPWRPTAEQKVELPGLPGLPLVEPGLHPRPFERPALGTPVELGPPLKVAANPYAQPHLWLGARTVAPGETVAVEAVGVMAQRPVRLALEAGQPAAFRFCGTGYADIATPVVRGECRVPPDAVAPVRVVAYEDSFDGAEIASAYVGVTPATNRVRVLTYDPPPGAALAMGGQVTPNALVRLTVFNPFDRLAAQIEARADDDGAWRARWLLPADALLGRWRITMGMDQAAWIADNTFVVRPLLGFEATREHVALYAAFLPPGTDVTYRFYDPTGEPAGELTTTANRLGMVTLHARAPACAPPGTWYARVHYTDALGAPAWYDVTFTTDSSWCAIY